MIDSIGDVRRGKRAQMLACAALAAMLAASVSAAQSQTAGTGPEVKYPIKIGTGLEVDQVPNPGLNQCMIRGFRALSPGGTDEGPLYILFQKLFDEKGDWFIRGQISLDVKKSAFTGIEPQPVDVRIELDGKTHDMPGADVHVAVLTFLNFRFPVELLNDFATAKKLKVYTLDPKTRAPTLFATSNIAAVQAAFPDFSRCANTLPDYPTELPGRLKLHGTA